MKKVLVFIIVLLSLLSGCNSKEYVAESIYGEMPTIEVSEQEFEDNMFEYATLVAQQAISETHWKQKYDEIVIGERIKTYGYENGELVELKSPYYYPLFLEGQLIMFVEVFNGENSPYVELLYGSSYFPNFTEIDDSAFYWRTDEFYQKDDPNSQELIDGMFLVFTNEPSCYTFYCSKQHVISWDYCEITLDDELLKEVRADIDQYNTYPLNREVNIGNEVHIVENTTATDLINENKEIVLNNFKERATREEISYKKVEVKDPINSYLYQVNIDLTVSFIQDVDNDLIYPIFVDGKYYCDAKVVESIIEGEKEVSYYIMSQDTDTYEKVKNEDFVFFHDITYFSKGIITKDEVIATGADCYDEEVISKLRSVLN